MLGKPLWMNWLIGFLLLPFDLQTSDFISLTEDIYLYYYYYE